MSIFLMKIGCQIKEKVLIYLSMKNDSRNSGFARFDFVACAEVLLHNCEKWLCVLRIRENTKKCTEV